MNWIKNPQRWGVGSDILNASEGLYENTIIVYAADNGLAIGSHGLLGKQNLYEQHESFLVLRGPEIPEKETGMHLVYLYDLFPTLLRVPECTQL